MTTVSGYVRDVNGDLVADATVRLYRQDTGALLAEGVTGNGQGIEGDPYYDNIVALIHFDGTDDSSVFTDNGPLGLTVTGAGSAAIKTAQSKFGDSSLYLPGGLANSVNIASNAALSFGTDDFTIEMWFRPSDVSYHSLLGSSGYNGLGLRMLQSNIAMLQSTVVTVNFAIGYLLSTNTWYHVAVSRESGVTRCFINGNKISTDNTDTTSYSVNSSGLFIGYQYGSYDYQGYIDEVRITKGVARYTANFSVQAAAFPNQQFFPAIPTGQYIIGCGSYTGKVIGIAEHPTDTDAPPLILRTTPV